MNGRFALTLSNRLPDVSATMRRIEDFSLQHKVPAPVVQALLLALEESLVNIVTHGYQDDQSHDIEVILNLDETDLCVEIKDDGMAFDPRTIPPPDLSIPADERPIGGLGVWLTLQMMDDVEYCRDGTTNRLRLIKRWRREANQDTGK
jgi:anti-sigma regulatory factor (Ser/Thr protein kinase)